MAIVLHPIVNGMNAVLVQLRTELRGLWNDADGAGFAISFFGRTSRGDFEYADRINAKLKLVGMQPWVYQETPADVHAISHWLEEDWDQDLPMLDSLLGQLDQRAAPHTMPVCSLNPTLIASKPDLRWQDRVAATAEPMQCNMGTFGPNAYCREEQRVVTCACIMRVCSSLTGIGKDGIDS